MRFTVLGSGGFVGRSLTCALLAQGHEVNPFTRPLEPLPDQDLGHVVYAVGLTANFRLHTPETIEAHAHLLARLMRHAQFQSWLYLSSTRIYGYANPGEPAIEEGPLRICPGADGIYDLSKLLGESVCLAHPSPEVRVARLSNVYGRNQGHGNFLGSLVDDLRKKGRVVIHEDPASSKDYVCIDDVVQALPLISLRGRERIYNVASGLQTSHQELAAILMRHVGGRIDFAPSSACRAFPAISIQKLAREFGYAPIAPNVGFASLLTSPPDTNHGPAPV